MFGLMTRGRYMREVTEAREAYRWERDEALAKVTATERKYHALLDALFPKSYVMQREIGAPRDRVNIVIQIDPIVFEGRGYFSGPDWDHIARKIITELQHVQYPHGRDPRGDMREVMPDGIGGPELRPRVRL